MLQVQNLVKHFGGIRAVDDVSLTVSPGECVALIGPNGAGKSTCFACIAGQYRPTSGSLTWRGQNLTPLPPAARLRLGIARTFQVAQVFEALTVLQNVQLCVQAGRGPKAISAFKVLDRQSRETASALLEKTGLGSLADHRALSLPYGAKKRLELAMALAPNLAASDVSGSSIATNDASRMLLLDEPAAGLAGPERAELMHVVKSLAAQGMAVLYTEHNMDAVAGVADRVLVLIEGRLVAQGSFDVISRDSTVRLRYLGTPAGEPRHA